MGPAPASRAKADKANNLKLKSPGGAWLAFAQREALGFKQRADFRKISEAYKLLTPEARAEFARCGKLATVAGRDKPRGQSAVGPATKEATRAAAKALRKQLAQRGLFRTIGEGQNTSVGEALVMSGGSLGQVEELANLARGEAGRCCHATNGSDERCPCHRQVR